MYVVTKSYHRPVTSIPFFSESKNEAALTLMDLMKTAPGFIDRTEVVSEDGLTLTVTTTWDSQDSAKAFHAANKNAFKANKIYNLSHGISKVV